VRRDCSGVMKKGVRHDVRSDKFRMACRCESGPGRCLGPR
jgi:hypothetical protein